MDRYEIKAAARFASFCVFEVGPLGCWMWSGGKKEKGYGCFSYKGRNVLAHRWAYELLIGPVPAELVLDHVVCETPACVNPKHCAPATRGVNTLRSSKGVTARNAAKQRCHAGHEFTPENTYVTPDGRRQCRACRRARSTTNSPFFARSA